MPTLYANVVGFGTQIPQRFIPNEELVQHLNPGDGWILERVVSGRSG